MNLVLLVYITSFIGTALSAIPLYNLFYKENMYTNRPSKIERMIVSGPGLGIPGVLFALGLGAVTLLLTTVMWLLRDKQVQSLYKKMYMFDSNERIDRLQHDYEEMKSNRHKRLEREIKALERGY